MNICQRPKDKKMPILQGKIGDKTVITLRDTGCSGAVVKKEFVKENQYTGKDGYMLLVDNSLRKAPIAKIFVNTPFYTGEIEALCLSDAIYDLIIGNIPGARAPSNPDPEWNCATSCSATTTTSKLNAKENLAHINNEDFKKIQDADEFVKRKMVDIANDKNYEIKNGLLYKLKRSNEGIIKNKQLVIPDKLKIKIMELAHDSKMSGHLGAKKTQDRISSNFYWPDMTNDVKRFCKSCDICQKTIHKGKLPPAPLRKMPLIDVPFQRVAIDIIGPI